MYNYWKLGKHPAKRDKRNFQFKDLLAKPVKIPLAYDFDEKNPVPTPMFRNDDLGDCVIAGRGHQTLRFELVEQKKILKITDTDITKEYFKESGGADSGLIVLDSLNLWRKTGWRAAGKTYKIKAFTEISPKDHALVNQAIYLNVGVGIGIDFMDSAMSQFVRGQVWDVVSKAKSLGGHYVYCCGYNKVGPVCVTWGRKQQMTWRFWDKYCEECYTMIDAKNVSSRINMKKLDAMLANITNIN